MPLSCLPVVIHWQPGRVAWQGPRLSRLVAKALGPRGCAGSIPAPGTRSRTLTFWSIERKDRFVPDLPPLLLAVVPDTILTNGWAGS
jgi:hypothetical protein